MTAFPKDTDGRSYRRRRRARDEAEVALVEAVRAHCVERENGLCRARRDGLRLPWCSGRAQAMHEESGVRGMGGRRIRYTSSLTVHKAIMTCDGCHNAHHGVGGHLHITIVDAERDDGVRFAARISSAERVTFPKGISDGHRAE